MSKRSASTLRDLLVKLEDSNLSPSKQQTIRTLVNDELSRQSDDCFEGLRKSLQDSYRWMERVLAHADEVKSYTSEDAEFISVELLESILQKMIDDLNSDIPSDYRSGALAVIDKILKKVRSARKISYKAISS